MFSEYQRLQQCGKALSVAQPYATLLVLGLKVFEGRARCVGKLNDYDYVWVCASLGLPAWGEFKKAMESARVPLDHPRFNEVYGVEAVTEENYHAIFDVGCAVGRVQFGERVERDAYDQKHLVPMQHKVVYPVLEAKHLDEGPWPAAGNTGNTFELAGFSVLEHFLVE